MSIRAHVQAFLDEFNLRDVLLGGDAPIIHDEAVIQKVQVSRISRELLSVRPRTYMEGLGFVQASNYEHYLFLDEQGKLIARYDGPPVWDHEKGKETEDLFSVIPKLVPPSQIYTIVLVYHNVGEDTGASWEEPGETNGDWNFYEVTVYKPAKKSTLTMFILEESQRRSNAERRRRLQKN